MCDQLRFSIKETCHAVYFAVVPRRAPPVHHFDRAVHPSLLAQPGQGGIKGGTVYGATDEFGFAAPENKVHARDLHATILALLGFDHEKLTSGALDAIFD